MLTPRLDRIGRELQAGDVWDEPAEAFYAYRLTPQEQDDICQALAKGLPRPGDGSDQPTLDVGDPEGWGFPIPAGTDQPTLF